jgi:hypothetical protein
MLPTDWVAPATSVLQRLSDRRVQQYWDPNHLLATQMKKDARAPQPEQDCCVRSGFLWDLAAVYTPGSIWSDRMPPAIVFNGPVVDVTDRIEGALVAGSGARRVGPHTILGTESETIGVPDAWRLRQYHSDASSPALMERCHILLLRLTPDIRLHDRRCGVSTV